jgi:limonene-1,2-epoxide hydrolase
MEPRELVRVFVEAFNRADVDTLTSLYQEDAIREMFRKGFATAEMTCIVENLFQDGEWAILEWRDPKGLRGCGFFQVRNDKILFQRGYWDKLSFSKSHGVPLEP